VSVITTERTTTSRMTHAQNGPILKSSRRRARSPLFRPVRCLSWASRTLLTTDCTKILAAMTPPHFQKKPPRLAPTKGSTGTRTPAVMLFTRPLSASSSPRSPTHHSVSSRQIHAAYSSLLFCCPLLYLESYYSRNGDAGCSEVLKIKTSFRNGTG
jgi:hypothetical protein